MTTPEIAVTSTGLALGPQADALNEAVARVLRSGRFVLGPEVEGFEREFSEYLDVGHACGVASGTDAIELALRAVGVGAGDLVLTVSNTAVATVVGIERAGATPVLVDVDPSTYNVDGDRLEEAVSSLVGPGGDGGVRLTAIVVVHLYGCPADMRRVLEIADRYGLDVVEDCAQAHGARWQDRAVGSMGRAGAFSFYPTKNLGGIGDGGMVVSNDAAVDARARALRQYGWEERYVSARPGCNSRLDEVQAAVLRARLPFLDEENDRRIEIAAGYGTALASSGLVLPRPTAGARHVFHQYVVRTPGRDDLRAALASRGVATAVLYPVPVHRQPAYAGRIRTSGPLHVTEGLCEEIVSLPMGGHLGPDDVQRVAESVLACTSP